MPCRSWGQEQSSEQEVRDRLDEATRVACELSRILESRLAPLLTMPVSDLLSDEAKKWIAEHKEEDNRQQEIEEQEKADLERIKEIISGLDDADINLLRDYGLDI